jgi:hypothetical protein
MHLRGKLIMCGASRNQRNRSGSGFSARSSEKRKIRRVGCRGFAYPRSEQDSGLAGGKVLAGFLRTREVNGHDR